MSWHKNFLAFDTETSGFSSNDHVLELAALHFVDGQVVETFYERFLPIGIDWDAESTKQAQAVNHITQEQLDGYPPFGHHVDQLLALLDKSDILVGHNAQFDARMLKQEFARVGRVWAPKILLCTYEFEKRLSPHPRKLADACPRWGVKLSNAHSAFFDAQATGELVLAMQRSGRIAPFMLPPAIR